MSTVRLSIERPIAKDIAMKIEGAPGPHAMVDAMGRMTRMTAPQREKLEAVLAGKMVVEVREDGSAFIRFDGDLDGVGAVSS